MSQSALPQLRAQHAWKTVESVAGKAREELASQSKKVPVRIQMSGLGQALAFLKGKNDSPELDRALSEWISTVYPPGNPRHKDLLQRIIAEDTEFLKLATAEAQLWLQWLKRFCEAEKHA
jgi:CRISPR type III-B/RAMP module-associated protein Cmr5